MDLEKKQKEAAAQRAADAEMSAPERDARDAIPLTTAINTSGERADAFVDDLKTGAVALVGTTPTARTEEVRAGLIAVRLEAAAGLTNDRQREHFDDFFMRRLETATAEIDRHVAERTAAKTAALMNSVIAREFETAVANFHDARAVRSAKLTGAAAIELGMAGQDPAAIKAAKNDFGSAIDTAIAAKILDDDPELGREFTAPPATPPTATRRRSSPCAGCPTAALAATDPRLHQNRLSAAEDRGFRTDSPFHMRFQ